jgi:hypothetical protein
VCIQAAVGLSNIFNAGTDWETQMTAEEATKRRTPYPQDWCSSIVTVVAQTRSSTVLLHARRATAVMLAILLRCLVPIGHKLLHTVEA